MCRVKKFNAMDFEQLPVSAIAVRSSSFRKLTQSPGSVPTRSAPSSHTFPAILHYMLESADSEGFSHIVSWQPHGRAFKVHDKRLFTSEIMPRYFRQTRFSSFNRQLNIYDFQRAVRSGPDCGAYYHAESTFLRGMASNLCNRIQRVGVKGSGMRRVANPDLEPNFYAMPPVGLQQGNAPAAPLVSLPMMRDVQQNTLAANQMTKNDKIAALLMNIKARQEKKGHTYQSMSVADLLSVFPTAAVGAHDAEFDIDTTFDSPAKKPILFSKDFSSFVVPLDVIQDRDVGDWVTELLNGLDEEEAPPLDDDNDACFSFNAEEIFR